MPVAPAISRTLHAVAEPRRREILTLLAARERSVNEVVARLGMAQPQVSKHLRVLRDAGLVNVREAGRKRLYRVNAAPLRPVHEWVRTFEKLWDHKLARIKERAESDASSPAPMRPTQPDSRRSHT